MARIKGRDTEPEMIVRRLLYRLGYRYRLHRRELPGYPDIVFKARRKVIFVNGCFWHQHPSLECKLARLPKSRLEYWLPKLTRNIERDLKTHSRLIDMGWQIMVIWECEAKHPLLGRRIRSFLEAAENAPTLDEAALTP